MNERERSAVQDLRTRLLTDRRKPFSAFQADDYAMLDCLKLAGFELASPRNLPDRIKEA